METLRSSQASASPVQVVLFDFDGTISTLRTGWEEVMRTVMFRYLSHGQAPPRRCARRSTRILRNPPASKPSTK